MTSPSSTAQCQRDEKGVAGLDEMAPERVRWSEAAQVAEGFERRRHRLRPRSHTELPGESTAARQDQTIDGGGPGLCGHDRLRRCISTFSHRDNMALTVIEMTRINKISGYIVLLSKLLKAKADLVADAAARHDELGADHADERIGDGELHAGQQIGRRRRERDLARGPHRAER